MHNPRNHQHKNWQWQGALEITVSATEAINNSNCRKMSSRSSVKLLVDQTEFCFDPPRENKDRKGNKRVLPAIIYCAGNNDRYAQIAIEKGWLYGSQLPAKFSFPLYFADQNWKKPDREAYIESIAEHRPHTATVLDWERLEQLDEVIGWAQDISPFVKHIVVIPKVTGEVYRIPHQINGKPIVLGYSVPTKYGGTLCRYDEFDGRKVHLLGGSPQKQMSLYCRQLSWEIVSCDGSMAKKMANTRCLVWKPTRGEGGHFQRIESDLAHDAPIEAFRRSSQNIIEAWQKFTRGG